MKTYSATTVINASPEAIWKILVDSSRYPEWDPGTEKIEGSIAPGQKFKAFPKGQSRAFPVKVAGFDPPRSMVWTGGMPLGLFKGVRTFTLTPSGDGKTELRVEEVFSGLLSGLIIKSLPDFDKIFADFVAGLKKRAEAGG
jgi:hypothetical protein